MAEVWCLREGGQGEASEASEAIVDWNIHSSSWYDPLGGLETTEVVGSWLAQGGVSVGPPVIVDSVHCTVLNYTLYSVQCVACTVTRFSFEVSLVVFFI